MVGMELQQRSWNTSSTGVVAGISEGLTGNMASCSNAVFETALFDLQLVCVCVCLKLEDSMAKLWSFYPIWG